MLAALVPLLPAQVRAQQAAPVVEARLPWIAVPLSRLDRLRGGFDLPSGLVMHFGIERVVYVNGQLSSVSRLNYAAGSGIGGDVADFHDTLLVQVGGGNTFAGTGRGGVVIQNSLDNQRIQVATSVDASVGTLDLFRSINQQAALQSALQGAVSP
jgi:hypothetical protein